jgi:hypothetical protein
MTILLEEDLSSRVEKEDIFKPTIRNQSLHASDDDNQLHGA